MGRLKSQTATANRPWQHNGKPNPLVGGAVRRSYRYDKAGNLIQSTDQRSGVLDYVYDALGRIESAAHKQTGKTEKFAFDPAHNILSGSLNTSAAEEGGISDRKGKNIGDGNRLKEYNGTEYTHDPLGNLIYRELPNGEKQYFQYDTENQLTRAEIKKPEGNTEIWEYAYDPFGRRLSKERKDKLAWVSTDPKRTHFVWDGTRLLQEYTYKGNYTYIYTDQDSYEPLAQVFYNNKDDKQYLSYYHTDQIGIPREMTDQFGNLLWLGEYTAWGCLKGQTKVYQNAHQPFRLQNQYFDAETGLHYNLMRYYEPDTGRFINQDPIGLMGGDNFYQFSPNTQDWTDPLGLKSNAPALAKNMAVAGRPLRTGQTAHHIVKDNASNNCVQTSVAILQRAKIDHKVDAVNGAALWGTGPKQLKAPGHPGKGAANYHSGYIHSHHSDERVMKLLQRAEASGKPNAVSDMLRSIGKKMEAGKWKAPKGKCPKTSC